MTEGESMRVNDYSDKFFRSRCSVTRTAQKLIVVHSTEGSTPEGGATTLSGSTDVSAHLCVGQGVTYRIVPEDRGSCTVREPNPWTLNIEQAGFAAWARWRWLKNLDTIKRTAFWIAWWQKKYGLPNRFRSTTALNAGKTKGWTTHGALAASKWSSSTHTDPGTNYPLFGKVSLSALILYYRGRIRVGMKPRKA